MQNQTTAGNDIVGARGGKERRREREEREVWREGKEEGERREGGAEGRKGGAANLICHEKRVKGSKTSA